ncbi:MAG TPA: SRPBCC domain-containing protein [Bacteroidia bacterium]|nr:SRPBCC domain-containing protein [Bacteroidia bacterium]
MPTIKQTYEIAASAEEVFEALVNEEIIQHWSGDEAKMSGEVGAKFSLWGGQMYGTNLEIIKNKKLVQEWCYDQWDAPSKVTFLLKDSGEGTVVELLHEEVPEKSLKNISEGWNVYYLGAIQEMFKDKIKQASTYK